MTELLEREQELAAIEGLVSGVSDGQGHMALIAGPAGIGKSRLLDAAVGAATEAGARVLRARGSELEREFPFGVVRQLFEPLLGDGAALERALEGGAAPARPVFEPLEDAMSDPSFAVLHGLYWMTVNLAGDRPLLLVVDDLHWTDRSSLRFVAYLVRRLAGLPVLVAAAHRPAEPGVDAVLMGEIAGDPQTTSLTPDALTAGAVGELVRERLGEDADERFSAACHEASGGNPLLLRELLTALEDEGVRPNAASAGTVRELGPRAASRAVLQRLARLPADAIAVARAVAVLGDGTGLASIAALAGLEENDAARATGALAKAEILRAEAPVAFSHPMVRDAVYGDVPPGERELKHAAAASLLSDSGAPADAVAAHILAMPRGGDPWAVDVLVGAARAALGRGAAESAVAYLRRALEEPPAEERRAEVLYALGVAEALTSGPSAAEHLRAAYDAIPDPIERARLATILAEAYTFTGRFRESAQIAIEAAGALPSGEVELRQALRVARALNAHFDASADLEAAAPVDPASIEGSGPSALLLQMQAAFDLARQGRPAAEVVPILVGAIRNRAFVETLRGGGTFALIVFLLALADRPEALQLCDAALADAHRKGSLFTACAAHIFRGFVLTRQGDLPAGEEMLTTGFEEIEAWGIEPGRSHGSAFLSDLYVERGDVAAARRAFERAGVPDDPPPMGHLVWWLVSRVRLLLAEGRFEEALGRAHDLSRRFEGVFDNPAFVPWRSQAAEALIGLGRREEAADLVEVELEMARVWGSPRPIARALTILGAADPENALPRLEEAVRLLEGSPARLELARALAALGGALRRDRRPAEARDPLRRALEIAGQCDARTLAHRVRSELYATGARPQSEGMAGVGALTASERRVVDLAAEGRTNSDIAQALYVTPKTIEVHLGNAFEKLGVRSRRELAGVLTQV